MLRHVSSSYMPTSAFSLFASIALFGVFLVPWQLTHAAGEQDAQKPSPPPMQQLKQKDDHSYYIIQLTLPGNLKPTMMVLSGVRASINLDGISTYSVKVSRRDSDKVRATIVWEERLKKPQSIAGQTLWSSHFTEVSQEIKLGKEIAIDLISPKDYSSKSKIKLKIEQYKTKGNK